MGGKDWMAEARKLLSGAAGQNDNIPAAAGRGGIHFHGPVTVNVIGEVGQHGVQLTILRDRLKRRLQAEGQPVANAFAEELALKYKTGDLDDLDSAEIAEVLREFDRLLRIARLLAVTPTR